MFPSDENFETNFTLETSSNIISDDKPFHLLLLGDWSGRNHLGFSDNKYGNNKFIEFDRDNFEEILRNFNIQIELELNNFPSNSVTVEINELDDFHPDNLFRQLPCFSQLKDIRERLLSSDTFNSAARDIRSWGDSYSGENTELVTNKSSQPLASTENLLDQILDQETKTEKPFHKSSQKSELDDFVSNLVKPHLVQIDESEQSKLLDKVDQVTGELMREILHHPKFKKLESSWRGLYFLAKTVETDSHLKIFLLDNGKDKLSNELKSVENLSDSTFFQLISGNDNNELFEKNWSAIFSDFEFNLNIDDTAFLMRLAKISSFLNAPFVSYIKPKILDNTALFNRFLNDSDTFFDETEFKLWDSLRSLPESRYLGFAFPQILGRLPYLGETEPIESFNFNELNNFQNQDDFLWTNPIYACAFLLAQSYISNGWMLRDNFQLQVNDLPFFVFKSEGETITQNSLQIVFNQNCTIKLMDLGFMIFLAFRDSDFVRIARFQSISDKNVFLSGKWDDF